MINLRENYISYCLSTYNIKSKMIKISHGNLRTSEGESSFYSLILIMASKKCAPIHEKDLSKLNLQQLTAIKQQLDHELDMFQDSMQALKVAQTKFQDSLESLEPINKELKEKPMLVPLTASMYVPGTVLDCEKVIIDIGTGYYIEKDVEGAKDYFKRKVAFLTEQLEKIQAITMEKAKVREAVMDVMEAVLQSQLGPHVSMAQSSGHAVKT